MINLQCLPEDCFVHIIEYLEKLYIQHLIYYFSNNTNKLFIKNILQKAKFNYMLVCKWTHQHNIQNIKEICYFQNVQYVSNICKNLTICDIGDEEKYKNNINIINNNIINLRIDSPSTKICNFSIISKSLKNLILVKAQFLSVFIIENIIKNCPELLTLKIIYSIDINTYNLNYLRNIKPCLKLFYK